MKIDTIMDEKIEILQCLIESNVFAPSPAAFAKVIGYKGKMTIYRMKKGCTTEKTILAVWDKLLARFHLDENILYNLYYIVQADRFFSGRICDEMNRQHPRWMENLLLSLFEGDYTCNSPDFKENIAPMLKDLQKDTPDVFWGMVALFYIKQRNINPYSGSFQQTECGFLNDLNRLLSSLYPENSNAHQAGIHLESMAEMEERTGCIWQLVFDGLTLLRYYAEPDFVRAMLTASRTFDWPHRSYWSVPGTTYHPKAQVWLLVENNMNTALHGFYVTLCLEAGKDTETFQVKETFILQFLSADSEEDEPVAQTYKIVNQRKKICYHLYQYAPDTQTLHFSHDPKTGNLYHLPETLQLLELSNPKGKDGKVWSRILERFEQTIGERLYQNAVEEITGIRNMSDEYTIKDVIISRTRLALILVVHGVEKEYSLPVDAYSFLMNIHPSHAIMITKHTADAEIYVEWPDLGYAIKLSEFGCREL